VTYIRHLHECGQDDGPLVGGKAVGLGRLLGEGLRVPEGFVVTTAAYREWLQAHELGPRLAALVERAESPVEQERVAEEIAALFREAGPGDLLTEPLAEAYRALDASEAAPVAVRSSATAEDGADASFAGQQETYLWVTGTDAVLDAVVRCWGSLFTPQAISYRRHLGIAPDDVAMAVVVQRMVDARAAGVMITLDPVTGDVSQITIEGAFGLGAPVVGGELTPDRYLVDKVTLALRSRAVAEKPFADRFDAAANGVVRIPLPEAEGSQPCLSEEEVLELARLGKQAERAFGGAQDLEWAVGEGPGGETGLYVLQARPETVWSRKPRRVANTTASALQGVVNLWTGGSRSR
jgi:pyruvate,water dikinase